MPQAARVRGAGAMTSLPQRHPYLVALGLLWVLPAILIVGLPPFLPTTNANGQCTGIGFGCTPAPADAVILFGMLAEPVLFVLGLVVCGVIALARRPSRASDTEPGPEDVAQSSLT